MAKAYDDDLRLKSIEAQQNGELGLKALASVFGVSYGWVNKIMAAYRKTGSTQRSKGRPRGFPSCLTPDLRAKLRSQIEKQPDRTPVELQTWLREQEEASVSVRRLSAALLEMGLGQKSLHAAEQNMEADRARRAAWRASVAEICSADLVFLDESGVTTDMTRRYGRALRGQRIHEAVLGGRWKTVTVLAAIHRDGLLAAMTISSVTDGEVFLSFFRDVLGPTLRKGQIVVRDNLTSHKVAGVAEAIAKHGASVLYLPPYSPDFNPIEPCWFVMKQALRSAKARTLESLDLALDNALKLITPHVTQACFQHCGYAL
jgi:transposase